MRISDLSSDVCSSDLTLKVEALTQPLLKIEAQFHDYSAISADGASVPYNVIARADVDLSKAQPTAIYGYGGFAVALVPAWRSEERRVGEGCVSTGQYRWWPVH